MTTKAIEAGARAMFRDCSWSSFYSLGEARALAKACLEGAIASGELVPASAVAAERERCIQAVRKAKSLDENGYITEKSAAIESIRALEPTSGEYVLVPMEPTMDVIDAMVSEFTFWYATPLTPEQKQAHVYAAMIRAATSNGSESE